MAAMDLCIFLAKLDIIGGVQVQCVLMFLLKKQL